MSTPGGSPFDVDFVRLAAVTLALGFSAIIAALFRRCFGGWASDAAMGKGACLSLVTIGLAVVMSGALRVALAMWSVDTHNVWIEAFGLASLCEESARLITMLILLRGMATDDPREFVAGVVAIGLGFGVIENMLYLSAARDVVQVGALRGVLSAPAHLSFSLATAYGLWGAARRRRGVAFAAAFFGLAVFLHGLFDVGAIAWGGLTEKIEPAFYVLTSIGIGLTFTVAIVATTVATIWTLSEFRDLAQDAPVHDPAVSASLGGFWRPFARVLQRIAALTALAPAAVGLAGDLSGALACAPYLLGCAASLGLWSMAIGQLALA